MKDKKNSSKDIDRAVALAYNPGESVPKVIAKGEGLIARNIIEKGKEEDIVIYEDKNLVDTLISLDIDDDIPEELYETVAEIIFYIYSLDSKKGKTL